MTCPKCRRKQYCGCPACIKRIPQGKLPWVDLEHDAHACPYCGFAEHYDYWEEREMQRLWRIEQKQAGTT